MKKLISVLSFYGRIFLHQAHGHSQCRSVSTTVKTLPEKKSLQKLSNFVQNEKEIVSKISKEYAEPFVSLTNLVENIVHNYPHKSPRSFLLKSVQLGQLHRPAVPIKYIIENLEEVEENWHRRKLPDENLDVRKDIVAPYERLEKIRQVKEKYQSEKDNITRSMKSFWIQHSKNNNSSKQIPPEIEESRQKSSNLGCIVSLLSWIENEVENIFYENALLMPNLTHPATPTGDESANKVIKTVNVKPESVSPAYNHMDIGEKTSVLRQQNIANFTGRRTYYLYKEAADLEQALVRYTIDKLKERGFHLISGPNILHGSAFEGCGLPSNKMLDIVYHIDPKQEDDFFLAGTSELSIAAFFANHAISQKHLPMKLCCVSTCNRKETKNSIERRGIYRIHHFTKVEMFGITANETGKESDELYQEFLQIQEELFAGLGIHFRIVNMATRELGLPAYQKVDMEAWMSGRNAYGEISSTSNCTDFQSRRLHILYKDYENNYKFAHTINGTACAVPRMIISLLENNQSEDRTIKLPEVLHSYLQNTTIDRSSRLVMEYIGPNQSKNKRQIPKE